MIAILLAVLGIIGGLVMTVLGDMVSEEARDRLDHLPLAILRLASRQVDPAVREAIYDDEWLPELTYILKGDESRPITRLFVGTHYALGILINARRIARHLSRSTSDQPGRTEGTLGQPFRPVLALPARFLVTLAGARPEILASCPGERKKFLSLGTGLLVTSAAASVSIWLTLMAAGLSPTLASVAAPIWGFINLGLDRWLAITMTGRLSRKLLIAAPRFLLAATLAGIISIASGLTLFQSPVSSQVVVTEIQDPHVMPTVVAFLKHERKTPGLVGVSRVQYPTLGWPGGLEEVDSIGLDEQYIGTLDGLVIGNHEVTLVGIRSSKRGGVILSFPMIDFISGNGPLVQRLEALGDLRVRDSAIDTTLVLSGLLALIVGCLPLTIKLAQRPGLYEDLAASGGSVAAKKIASDRQDRDPPGVS